jgi:hypothetical protein
MKQDEVGSIISGLCRAGRVAALVLLVYCLATILQLMLLGGQPSSAAEAFDLLQTNRIVGLLRLDLPTVLVLPFYYLLFLALAAVLWPVDAVKTIVSALFVFAGVTLALATPMALSMIPLSTKYASATTDEARNQFLAAGEAILATDMWHGTGALIGGLLTQSGAVLISLVMLRSSAFSQMTGWLGLVMHGLDLAHIIVGLFLPTVGAALLAVAGPLYPIWFFLVGRSLLQMGPSAQAAIRDRGTVPAFKASNKTTFDG